MNTNKPYQATLRNRIDNPARAIGIDDITPDQIWVDVRGRARLDVTVRHQQGVMSVSVYVKTVDHLRRGAVWQLRYQYEADEQREVSLTTQGEEPCTQTV